MSSVASLSSVPLFTTITCGCGGMYALPEPYLREKRRLGKGWNCPFCMSGWGYYTDGPETERLKKELENANRLAEMRRDEAARARVSLKHAVNQANGYKGAMVKVRKRIQAGVCPDCNRHFANVEAHMNTKHNNRKDSP